MFWRQSHKNIFCFFLDKLSACFSLRTSSPYYFSNNCHLYLWVLFNEIMYLWGYHCLLLLTMNLICIMIVGLYERHAYYDNTYLSSTFHLKILSGLQRRWISLSLFYIGTYFCKNYLALENCIKDTFRLLIRRMTKREKSRRMNNKCIAPPDWNGICFNKTWKDS